MSTTSPFMLQTLSWPADPEAATPIDDLMTEAIRRRVGAASPGVLRLHPDDARSLARSRQVVAAYTGRFGRLDGPDGSPTEHRATPGDLDRGGELNAAGVSALFAGYGLPRVEADPGVGPGTAAWDGYEERTAVA